MIEGFRRGDEEKHLEPYEQEEVPELLPDNEEEDVFSPKPIKNFLKKEDIDRAESLDNLIKKISEVDKIKGIPEEGEYDPSYVIKRITDFRDFLRANMEDLQLSVITNKKGIKNDELLKKLVYIPLGLGLRGKVKDLMEREWNEFYARNREVIKAKVPDADNTVPSPLKKTGAQEVKSEREKKGSVRGWLGDKFRSWFGHKNK